MAVAEKTQTITAFMGLQEGLGSLALSKVFSSADSKNVWMDEFSRVTRISGYAKQNSSAVTTDTGGSATALVGLASYRKVSGGSISRSLVGVFDDGSDEWEIHTSGDSGATWTFRVDLGSSPVGKIPDFSQFGDVLYITSGGAAVPREWDNSSITTSGSTQSPTVSAASGVAGNLSGDYEWKLVSKEADGTTHYASATSSNVQLANEAADLTWTADTDANVVGYDLYQTTGTGLAFYFHSYIDGRTTASVTVDKPDNELLAGASLEVHGDAPPSCYLVEPHKQRMWWGRTDTEPRAVYFSDVNKPDSTWQSNNFLRFDDDFSLGDFITALAGGFEGALVAFLERSIWLVTGSGAFSVGFYDWNVRRTSASIGTVSHRAIARVQAGARYTDEVGAFQQTSRNTIAYFTPHGDIRLFDGSQDIVISGPVKDLVNALNYSVRDQVFCVDDPKRSHLTWFFPSGSTTYPNDAVTWNYRYGIWYNTPTPSTFASGISMETATAATLYLLGEAQTSVGGFCYQLWSGNSFNGVDITSQWLSKPLVGASDNDAEGKDIAFADKRFNWVSVVAKTATTIMLDWFSGFPASLTSGARGTLTLAPVAGAGINSSDGNPINTVTSAPLTTAAEVASSGRQYLVEGDGNITITKAIRYRVYDISSNAPWIVEQLTHGYQLLPDNLDSYND